MSDNKLDLKSIYDLLGYNFYVPSYQRGYRWNKTQVTQLLEDIWEFADKDKEEKKLEFYCLQPIVVKSGSDNSWEVIDGQQRLTTIKIIIKYLAENHLKRPLSEAFRKEEFSISYKTRPDSESFLNNIKKDYSCIDFYHMWVAYKTTIDWFAKKDYNDCDKFIRTLLAKEDKDNPVKVIWYQINDLEESDAIDVFTRLNIGKIPLTNAELIKALFLGTANPKNKNQIANSQQIKIASEWDIIESTMQDKSFWHFIYDKNNENLPQHNYDTRIEYIFDLYKNKQSDDEQYSTFYRFIEEDFIAKKKVEDIWVNIKKYFLTFEEWYRDRDLYHLIGFLIVTGSSLKLIKDKADMDGMTKIGFKDYLKKEIAKKVNIDIETLNYTNSKHRDLIQRVLLLMNIQTLLANKHSQSRFPFDSYKNENWDIEHVRSQAEVELKGEECIDWARLVLEFYTGNIFNTDNLQLHKDAIKNLEDEEKSICERLIGIIENGVSKEEFNEIYLSVAKAFQEDKPPQSHSIANLAILDSGTNRAYKNAFFPIKRMEIMKREMMGSFVPICTKNLFMKAYSRRFDKIMYWDNRDASDYLNAIKSTLHTYNIFNQQSNGE
jgi:hypothetical protein